jgi:thiosulfate/3-mercaptopyruvate sulfurtransferase
MSTTISAKELKELIDSGAHVKIFDCTVKMMPTQEDPNIAYQKCHIHGAHFLDLQFCRDHSSPHFLMMPKQSFFQMVAKQYDIRKSDKIVVYDSSNGAFAHRARFMITTYGHADVKVLDGGIAKWKAEGFPVHAMSTIATADDYNYDLVPGLVHGFEDVKQASSTGSHQIVDARPAEMFTKGAIPNAKNVSSSEVQHPDGKLKSAEEIKAAFAAAGVDITQPMIMSC